MNMSDIQAALDSKLTPIEVVRYVRRLANKAKRGLEPYLHFAAENMVIEMQKQDEEEEKLAAAGTPLSEELQAKAVFDLHMTQVRDAFIAGGLYALHQHDYDISGGMDAAEEALEGLTPDEQRAKVKKAIERDRGRKSSSTTIAGASDDLAEMLAKATGKSVEELKRSGLGGNGLGAMKIVQEGDGGGAAVEFLGEAPTPELAEQLGKAITAALKAAASGQKGPVQVGDMTITRDDDDTPLSKMN